MTALALIAHLAGRGLMLSIEGARLRAAPASLLTDEDRRLIRRSRKELFALLSERARTRPSEPGPLTPEPPAVVSVEAVEPMEAAGRTGASMVLHHRPDSLARWPIPDRQRWGELANQLEAEGVSWQEAERRAYETIRGEREADGRSGDFVFIEEHPTPEPFPKWDDLIDPREPPPVSPRPGSPTWGVTKSIRVVELATWTPGRQARDPVIKVTAEGWGTWCPVEPRDLPRAKGAAPGSGTPCLWPSKPPSDLDELDVPPEEKASSIRRPR
jgi:hypothetical protein